MLIYGEACYLSVPHPTIVIGDASGCTTCWEKAFFLPKKWRFFAKKGVFLPKKILTAKPRNSDRQGLDLFCSKFGQNGGQKTAGRFFCQNVGQHWSASWSPRVFWPHSTPLFPRVFPNFPFIISALFLPLFFSPRPALLSPIFLTPALPPFLPLSSPLFPVGV